MTKKEGCSMCGNTLDDMEVYSNRGMSFKCCSIKCLAECILEIRVYSLEMTKKLMGETD